MFYILYIEQNGVKMEYQKQLQIRKTKDLEIVKTDKIKQQGNKWAVPSQSINKYYEVILKLDKSVCNCPDYAERQIKCKHIFAVEITVSKSLDRRDGCVTVTQTKRLTYSQEWSAYNKAQTSELKLFDELLKDLVEQIDEPAYTFGRPKLSLQEQVFCSVIKVYSQLSSKRASTLYKYAVDRGFIQHKPHFNAVSKLLNREEITPVLKELLYITTMPLKNFESKFAIDSSGFRTTSFNAYCKERHKTNQYHDWLKAHICIGTLTNIITGIEIGMENDPDSPRFIPLVKTTSEAEFTMQEVSADKTYNSMDNYNAVQEIGGQTYIPFKNNATGRANGASGHSKGRLWRKMFHYFQLNQKEFMGHYHKRSNVESAFSAIKKKLGEMRLMLYKQHK